MFRISEFARFTRVSVKMLRHYHEIGLFRPERVDQATGYRYYVAAQLPRLNRVLLLRDLGFGLDDIATMLDDGDLDAVLADRERALVEDLRRARETLHAVRARRDLLRRGTPPADVLVRPVSALLVATLTGGAGEDVADLFGRLETYVRDRHARAIQPPLSLLPDSDDAALMVAVPLSWPLPPGEGVEVRMLEAVPRMASVVHRGGYAELAGLLQQMLTWLADTGEQLAGPIREVYLRFGAEAELGLPPAYLTEERAALVTELQVPLTPRTRLAGGRTRIS